MSILVIGGTGTVGSQVIAELLRRGEDTHALVRSTGRGQTLPAEVAMRIGDLERPVSLDDAFEGEERIFLLNSLSPTETEQGLAAVEAAKRAGVRKIVYMSVAMPEGSKHIPHFKSKIPVEEAVRDSGAGFAILRPNNFMQNDVGLKDAVLNHRVYPQPLGNTGLSRVDVRDIAEMAARSLTGALDEAREVALHGPDVLTGDSVAEAYSRRLGFEVRYGGDDLKLWAQQVRGRIPDWMIEDLSIMYDFFQKYGMVATPAEMAAEMAALGHEPRNFERFVAEIAPQWTGQTQQPA